MEYTDLCNAAKDAMKNSYSPYSDFKVGAALLCKNGNVYTGCNIENGAFTPTVCAERVAFFKAVSDGIKDFEAIAVAGGKSGKIKGECPPCGVCRQVMSEFCGGDFKILVVKNNSEYTEYLLSNLLPESFSL